MSPESTLKHLQGQLLVNSGRVGKGLGRGQNPGGLVCSGHLRDGKLRCGRWGLVCSGHLRDGKLRCGRSWGLRPGKEVAGAAQDVQTGGADGEPIVPGGRSLGVATHLCHARTAHLGLGLGLQLGVGWGWG